MATIKELNTEINNYFFPNILQCEVNGGIDYQINGIWIDQIKENYFYNETIALIQMIENTVSTSGNPILIINDLKSNFEKRFEELNAWKKIRLTEYLMKYHAVAMSENEQEVISYEKSKVKKITLDMINQVKEPGKLFNLHAFYNLVKSDEIHHKEEFENIKLLHHMNDLINNMKLIIDLLNEIVYDHNAYKIVKFEHYFKSYYHQYNNKVQVKLKLKDLAFFFHFVTLCDVFVMHSDKYKNKRMLMDFFMKNFMYTNTDGDPVHFKNFTKEVTDATTIEVENKFKDNFADELIGKLNYFKSKSLFLSR